MTLDQLIDILLAMAASYGGQAPLAAAIGITPQRLNDVISKRQAPPPQVLEFLRLEKTTCYTPKETTP